MTPQDIDTMARTLYGEARGEPLEGKIAVAWVIRNRADNPSWWGKDIKSVCRKPFQFSCWNENDPNRAKLVHVTIKDEMFRECLAATAAVLSDNVPDPTRQANHYHTSAVAPIWSAGKEPSAKIGRHLFYNLS